MESALVGEIYWRECPKVYTRAIIFLVYINDLTSNLKCNIKLFADDTFFVTVVHESSAAAEDMNHDLRLISQWAYDWRMSFAPDPQKQAVKLLFFKEKR